MKIQINTQCFQYWKRLFWSLSSIVEQVRPIPDLKIRINTCLEFDKYKHIRYGTEKIFKNLLNIEWIDWNKKEDYNRRENIRNKDFESINDNTEWMLWVDPDQLYHPNHFNFILNHENEFNKSDKLLSLIRHDIPEDQSNNLIKSYWYRRPVKDCISKLNSLTVRETRGIMGAGYYQLVSTKTLKEKNIKTYSINAKDLGIWNRVNYIFKTSSDITFRKKIGVKKINDIPYVYHLEHPRLKQRLEYFEKDSL